MDELKVGDILLISYLYNSKEEIDIMILEKISKDKNSACLSNITTNTKITLNKEDIIMCTQVA